MASYSVAKSKHATLAASTVDSVTVASQIRTVEVVNRSATDDIYFRVDGVAPVVGADDTIYLGPKQALVVDIPGDADVVKLISAGTPSYSVTGV